MRVETNTWMQSMNSRMNQAAKQSFRLAEKRIAAADDEEDNSLKAGLEEELGLEEILEEADTGSQPKSSVPKSQVGAFAAMVAKAKTKMDLIQVSSKATKALINLKIAAAFAEGDDKKKISQQVARMEKLMKRINKKMKELSKEEMLELEKERAAKKQEMEKVQELQTELRKRRTKRQKEERKYADKEASNDKKANDEILAASQSSAGAAAPVTEISPAVEASIASDAALAEFSADGCSFDMTV